MILIYVQIREDTKTGVYVDNLSEEFVSSVQDVTRILVKV
jgi:kinesin family protein 15